MLFVTYHSETGSKSVRATSGTGFLSSFRDHVEWFLSYRHRGTHQERFTFTHAPTGVTVTFRVTPG